MNLQLGGTRCVGIVAMCKHDSKYKSLSVANFFVKMCSYSVGECNCFGVIAWVLQELPKAADGGVSGLRLSLPVLVGVRLAYEER
jgi:hypothetical protein